VREWGERVGGIGADLLIQPPNSSIFLAFSSAVLPQQHTRRLEQLPEAKVVSPVVAVVDTTSIHLIYGIDYESYNRLGRGFLFHAGTAFRGPYDVIIDDIKAHSRNYKVGDTIKLLNTDFRICGIVEHGRGARYFIPLKTAQELLGVENRVSMFWLQSAGNAEALYQHVVRLLPRHQVRLMDEYLSLMVSSNLPEVRPFTQAVILVGLIITFLVILLSMYTVVLERTREIGILKALGASRWNIAGLLLRESVLIAFMGLVVGIASTYAVKEVVSWLRPTLTIAVTPEWLLQAVALALLGAVLGSLYPALRAAGTDAVTALAYE